MDMRYCIKAIFNKRLILLLILRVFVFILLQSKQHLSFVKQLKMPSNINEEKFD